MQRVVDNLSTSRLEPVNEEMNKGPLETMEKKIEELNDKLDTILAKLPEPVVKHWWIGKKIVQDIFISKFMRVHMP